MGSGRRGLGGLHGQAPLRDQFSDADVMAMLLGQQQLPLERDPSLFVLFSDPQVSIAMLPAVSRSCNKATMARMGLKYVQEQQLRHCVGCTCLLLHIPKRPLSLSDTLYFPMGRLQIW